MKGGWFHSKYYPDLKYFIHTGFDVEKGCLNYKGMFLKNPEVSKVLGTSAALTDSLPFYTKITTGKNGIEVSVTKTHGECGDVKSLEFIRNVTNNKYFELA
jgi:hypothetical protein